MIFYNTRSSNRITEELSVCMTELADGKGRDHVSIIIYHSTKRTKRDHHGKENSEFQEIKLLFLLFLTLFTSARIVMKVTRVR